MLIGSLTGVREGRAVIHDSSCHAYREVNTTDAVAGGRSAKRESGSALSRHTPSKPHTEYLYRAPSATPGMNSSHTPDTPSERIGNARPSQKLKSPVTRTPRAFGAQTANDAPVTWSTSRTCAPSACQSSSCLPSPIRYRSYSLSCGRNRYGSSATDSSSPSGEYEVAMR